VRAIEDGAYTPTLKARLTALEQEKAQTEARLHAGKHAPLLRLHTNLPELYRNKIGRLAEALNAPETVTEAAEIMRGLIDRIVLMPVDSELRAELHGDLAVLARFAQGGNGDLTEIRRDYRWLRGSASTLTCSSMHLDWN
jgi:site-specific DNA recombinase